MQSQHQQMIKNNLNKNTFDELTLQNFQAWKAKCKEFLQNALEIIIQQREASFGNSNPSNPLKQVTQHISLTNMKIQFGMHINNMNDIRSLLSAFDPMNQVTPQEQEADEDTMKPFIQELFLDVTHTNRIGSVLSERWNFALALSPFAQQNTNVSKDDKRRLADAQKSGNEFIQDVNQDFKTEYDLKYDIDLLKNEFYDQSQIKVKQLASISNHFGDLSIEVQYIDQNDIIRNFQSLHFLKQDEQRRAKPNAFQQSLMSALGPCNNLLQVPQGQPSSSFIVQLKPSSNIGQINNQGRFRANSDNTYNQSIAQRALKQQYLANSRNNMNSPGPSDNIMIKEDYFTAEKNKFYYQISNKHSGYSNSSAHSNKSSEFSKKGTPPFIPQINCLPTTQGSSTVLKSSLDGNGGFGNFDMHDFNSNRPSRPKIDPFKKFDNLNTSRNRNYRLSFDEGSKQIQSQRSLTSLFNPANGAQQNSFRKGSINMLLENSNSKSNKQLILEETQNDFDLIQNPFNNNPFHNGDIAASLEKTNNDGISPSQFYHVLPRKSSSIFKNEGEVRASLTHESIKRISSCSEMFPGGDPLFQIDEKKKYIGFLEESDEEKSQSDGTDDSEDEDQDFMEKIEQYQNKLQREIQKENSTCSSKHQFQEKSECACLATIIKNLEKIVNVQFQQGFQGKMPLSRTHS
ncbi:UNKNOWN [Stylonychia lemnae]|uniref:Autophagy-related protein 13 N-terminal domain-containing protein n=1 Tax=Stylonychia lemnae TaxID=5949 RepID=A0A078A877_STYLE|nr:UNKNOWN [Stylonychia lemnae]|eukprot:CDW78071.1 UNKNOWN [Stylonychia lemnae]